MNNQPSYLEALRPLFVQYRLRHIALWLPGVGVALGGLDGWWIVLMIGSLIAAIPTGMYVYRQDQAFQEKLWSTFTQTYADRDVPISRPIRIRGVMGRVGFGAYTDSTSQRPDQWH